VSVNTLYRVLAREGLDARSLSAAVSGPTKAYELSWANQLWTTDGMWGPSVPLVCGGKPVRTHLLGIIDDCSRLCVHAQYYPGERLVHFLDTLKQALQSRGIPDKLYTDNGAVFVSPHLNTVCANFGIRLLHAKPYHSWSKGKIERFWATVQGDFEQRLVFTPATSLEDLNRRFWQWLESDYHQRAHGGLDGQSPAQRFRERSAHLRLVDPAQDIVSLFLSRCRRRVRRDATFSIDGHLFEAPAALRGRPVDVHYDPFGWSRLDLYWNGQLMGQAHPCDKQANARRSRKEDYENF
jgi:transposase InsO family protein